MWQFLNAAGQIKSTNMSLTDSTPVGTLVAYGGSTAPSGWLICDGSAVSRATYAELFNVLGTTYGVGDGSTTFNLPDLRGRTLMGSGTGTGGGASGTGAPTGGSALTARTRGAWAGTEAVTLALTDIPDHAHGRSDSGFGTGSTPAGTTDGTQRASAGADTGFRTTSTIYASGTYGSAVRGAQTGHTNLQPFIVTTFIIRWDGSTRNVTASSVVNARTINVSSSLTNSDAMVLVNTSSVAITITLPAAHNAGTIYQIKDISGNAHNFNITVDPADADTIDGQSTYTLNVPYESVKLCSDGTNWFIV